MNSHLQSIIEKCKLANPKLLELTPWCVVKEIETWKTFEVIQVVKFVNFIIRVLDWNDVKAFYPRHVEILWHPITLQDILLVLWNEDYAIDGKGNILKWDYDYDTAYHEKTWIVYDLTKSPYDQSEDVLEFISKNI